MTSIPDPRPPQGEAGFTLLELLVALAVLGLTALMMSSAISAMVYAGKVQNRISGDPQVAAAQRLLRARIEHLVPVPRDDLAIPRVRALGLGTRFEFIAPPADRDPPGALRRYRLELTPGGALTLLSASTAHLARDDLDTSQRGWTRTVLLDGVRRLTLDYFGADPRSAEPRWQTDWRDRTAAPDLVRVRLDPGPGRTGGWPDLVVPVRAAASLNCPQIGRDGRCAGTEP